MISLDHSKIALRVAGAVRTAGKIEFVKDTGPIRRDIRVEDFKWSEDSLKNLAKILWAVQRSHSYAVAAHRIFSKMPSSEYSPDGLLGGRGYIQNIKDMRSSISSAIEVLSAFTDTVYDEINATHWKKKADEEVDDIVDNYEEVKENPDQFIENAYEKDVEEPAVENPKSEDLNPHVEDVEEIDGENESEEMQSQVAAIIVSSQNDEKKEDEKEEGSKLPADNSDQSYSITPSEMVMKTTAPNDSSYFASAIQNKHIRKDIQVRRASENEDIWIRLADAAIPVETLSGPRVEHIGPGMGDDWMGSFNPPEDVPSDDPMGDGFYSDEYIYEDWCGDGVTGYDNPTDGDTSVLKTTASKIASGYSWLPGSTNEKNLDYYRRGLTEQDINWMREHNEPDPPPGTGKLENKLTRPDMHITWTKDYDAI